MNTISRLRAGLVLPISLFLLMIFAVPTLSAQTDSTAVQEIVHESFTEARFVELQAAGEYVLIDIFATWCPTCAKQQKVLTSFREQHPDAPLHMLQIDFDDQKKWVKHFKAPRQSTLILYKGEEQIWFSVAQTRQDEIFAELNVVLSQETANTSDIR